MRSCNISNTISKTSKGQSRKFLQSSIRFVLFGDPKAGHLLV